MLKKFVQQGRSTLSLYEGVAGMIPTARVQRGLSQAARCASTGIVPATPHPFSASCCASCAALGPMVGYHRCIWSGGKACGRRTGRRIYRSRSAGWRRTGSSRRSCTSRLTGGTPPRGCTLRFAPGHGNSCHLFILRHFTGQLFDDVDGGTVGSSAASDPAQSTASERHYRLALGFGNQDRG